MLPYQQFTPGKPLVFNKSRNGDITQYSDNIFTLDTETSIEEKNGVYLKRFEREVQQENGSWKKEAFYEVGIECEWSEPFTRKQSAIKYFKECIAE